MKAELSERAREYYVSMMNILFNSSIDSNTNALRACGIYGVEAVGKLLANVAGYRVVPNMEFVSRWSASVRKKFGREEISEYSSKVDLDRIYSIVYSYIAIANSCDEVCFADSIVLELPDCKLYRGETLRIAGNSILRKGKFYYIPVYGWDNADTLEPLMSLDDGRKQQAVFIHGYPYLEYEKVVPVGYRFRISSRTIIDSGITNYSLQDSINYYNSLPIICDASFSYKIRKVRRMDLRNEAYCDRYKRYAMTLSHDIVKTCLMYYDGYNLMRGAWDGLIARYGKDNIAYILRHNLNMVNLLANFEPLRLLKMYIESVG